MQDVERTVRAVERAGFWTRECQECCARAWRWARRPHAARCGAVRILVLSLAKEPEGGDKRPRWAALRMTAAPDLTISSDIPSGAAGLDVAIFLLICAGPFGSEYRGSLLCP